MSTDQTSDGQMFQMTNLNQGSNAEGVGVFGVPLHNHVSRNLQVPNNLHSVSSLDLEENRNPSKATTHHPLKVSVKNIPH